MAGAPGPGRADDGGVSTATTAPPAALFAVYALALLVTLLPAGSVSDAIGRRPLVFILILIEMVSLDLRLDASSVGWLYGVVSGRTCRWRPG